MVIDRAVRIWRGFVDGSLDSLNGMLADAVEFHSPVVLRPLRGRDVTTMYLRAAVQVLHGQSEDTGFRFTREVVDGHVAVLEFETSLDGTYVNGVDILQCDESGRVVEFRVMVRPLQALDAVHRQMGRMLASMQPGAVRPPDG